MTGCSYKDVLDIYTKDEFFSIIDICSRNDGVIHIDSSCLFCALPICNPSIETKSKIGVDKKDTWFIYIAVGDLKKAFKNIERLDFISYERFDGKIRTFEFDRMRRLLNG